MMPVPVGDEGAEERPGFVISSLGSSEVDAHALQRLRAVAARKDGGCHIVTSHILPAILALDG